MKHIFITLISIILLVGLSLAGDKWDHLCPICKEQGLKSKVYIDGCNSTLVFCGNGYYNEEGFYISPNPCNSTSCNYHCSNGHSFSGSY